MPRGGWRKPETDRRLAELVSVGVLTRVFPPELVDRRIVTVDELPPPADGAFHPSVRPVPAAVAARSTWSARCPVTLAELTMRAEVVRQRLIRRPLEREKFTENRLRVAQLRRRDGRSMGSGHRHRASRCVTT